MGVLRAGTLKMAEMDATQQTPKQKKKTRQKGKARLELFSEWIDWQLDGIEAAREELGRMRT